MAWKLLGNTVFNIRNIQHIWFLLYTVSIKQTKKLDNNFQVDSERFCYSESNVCLMRLPLIWEMKNSLNKK